MRKFTRVKRKALKFEQAVKDLQAMTLRHKWRSKDCNTWIAKWAAADSRCEDVAKHRDMLQKELVEYKRWEKDVEAIVGSYSLVLRNLTELQLSELPPRLQFALPQHIDVLQRTVCAPHHSFSEEVKRWQRGLLLEKLTVLSQYDVFRGGLMVAARCSGQESVLYMSQEAMQHIPTKCLAARISQQLSEHLATNLKRRLNEIE